MSIGEMIAIAKLCLKLAPSFVLIGLGLRYLFYDVDSWNLDRVYEKYFRGRRKKRYRQFTQRTGLACLLLGLLYTWLMVWPMFEEFLRDRGA